MMYPLFRPFLFALDPETAHEVVVRGTRRRGAGADSRRRSRRRSPPSPVTAMGLTFPNRVGLAAGLDKNAAHIDGLAALGFGFIECGTVTPRAQPGNPKPRLFRLPEADALINRMGFNNDGVERFLANVARASWRGILGLNIGKNFDTPNARAVDDYLACLRAVYARASYVTVNISSPNTKGLRDLQAEDALDALLAALKTRAGDARRHARQVHADRGQDRARPRRRRRSTAIAQLLVRHRIDGVIATNTTVARDAVTRPAPRRRSGRPVGAAAARSARPR